MSKTAALDLPGTARAGHLTPTTVTDLVTNAGVLLITDTGSDLITRGV